MTDEHSVAPPLSFDPSEILERMRDLDDTAPRVVASPDVLQQVGPIPGVRLIPSQHVPEGVFYVIASPKEFREMLEQDPAFRSGLDACDQDCLHECVHTDAAGTCVTCGVATNPAFRSGLGA